MIKNYIRSSLAFLLFFLFPTMAFANGGLPIWINTIQSVAATSGIRGLGGTSIKLRNYTHLFNANYIL